MALNDEETKHLLLPGETELAWTIDWLGQNEWVATEPRTARSHSFACTRASIQDGSREVVITAGGFEATTCHDTVEVYDIQTGIWLVWEH